MEPKSVFISSQILEVEPVTVTVLYVAWKHGINSVAGALSHVEKKRSEFSSVDERVSAVVKEKRKAEESERQQLRDVYLNSLTVTSVGPSMHGSDGGSKRSPEK